MTAPAQPERRRTGVARIRLLGTALLLAFALLVARAPWSDALQSAWFDLYQRLWPRPPAAQPVTVVELDARSLQALGPWPWPRTTVALLVDTIAAAQPAALGLDLLMPEADVLSPERLLVQSAVFDSSVLAALGALPSNDAALGDALRRTQTVLAVAGLAEPAARAPRSAPIGLRPLAPGDATPLALTRYPGALASLESLDRQAGGWGLASIDATRGVVRRMPLVASVGTTLMPALSVELLRVAQREPELTLGTDGAAVRNLHVGRLAVPTEPDGRVRPWFSPRRADRYVSAVDVMQGRADPAQLRGRIVIVGAMAFALNDLHATPLGERLPGSELHAQLLENLVDGRLLRRPDWAAPAEALLLLALGAALLWVVPRWRAWQSALLLSALVLGATGAGVALFHGGRWLLDAASPGLGLLALFVSLLVMTLTESTRQRRSLERVVQSQREEAARVAGEMAAAQRIQSGSLPRPDLLQGERRAELQAVLVPAREVGGDLYDYFRLDDRRLFMLVGDVSGKGLPASIFMAVCKALFKAAMLRTPDADVGDIVATVNAELSRDNAEALFVTAFAAIVDLDTGRLRYCNAGHENPYLLRAGVPALQRIGDGDGPPLCTAEAFPYRSAQLQLARGDTLCLITDGINEAQDAAGALYGNQRLHEVLSAQHAGDAAPQALVQALHEDVVAFVGAAAAADDLTILALRWNGRG
ncbi:MAG TPA: CHASE2 domain-containing protein [Burkholderiaceae bacterium]|nr:CHASE2 domain-containing protein [Burkholderiaceae bacterium]